MHQLKKGDRIIISGEEYRLLEDPDDRGREGKVKCVTWGACVRGEKGNKYFLKYAEMKNKHAVERIRREGSFCMDYPYIEHIITTFQYELEDGTEIFGALGDYIEGDNLKRYWAVHRHMEEKKKFRFIMQLLNAVNYYTEYVKGDGFLHRDLKPENVMITEDENRVVIIDFDASHIPESDLTISGYNEGTVSILGGTPGYTDPRCFAVLSRGKLIELANDIRADIYALGRTVWFLLTGREYFTGEELDLYRHNGSIDGKTEFGILESRVPPQYREEEYRELLRILNRMTAPLEERYTEASEIIQDMKRYMIWFFGSEEEYESVIEDSCILRSREDRALGKSRTVGYKISTSPSRTTYALWPFQMHDIVDKSGDNALIMAIYNIGDQVKYIPYAQGLRKENEDGTYCIRTDDVFYFGDKTIDFIIV